MIDGVNVHLKISLSPAAFSLMWANADNEEAPPPDYKIKLKEIAIRNL